MKKMKKGLSIAVFTVMFIVSFVVCKNEPSDSDKQTGGSTTEGEIKDKVISIAAIPGVSIPSVDAPAARTVSSTEYSGTIEWLPNHTHFAISTVYEATITLSAKPGYTLQGVPANFFTVAGATTVSGNAADSGVITVVFPITDNKAPDEAQFNKNKFEYYWVNERDNLVTTSSGELTLIAGQTLTISAAEEGYTVKNWYLNSILTTQSGNDYTFSGTKIGEYVVTLIVEKDGKPYNTNITITINSIITYDINNGVGEAPSVQTVSPGSYIRLPSNDDFSRTGYTFSGWNTNPSGTGTNYNAGASYTQTANTTLYASWTSIVTFNINEGTGTSPSEKAVSAGSGITLPDNRDFSKTGYTFAGWNIYSDGSGTNYNAGSSYTPTGNVTLYANWTSTVTFDINNGTGTTPSEQTVSAGSVITLPNDGGFSRTGYAFRGWNTESDGTGTNYDKDSSYTPTGDIILYADWIVTRVVTIVMYDAYGEWDADGALRINVNGTDIENVSIPTGTYTNTRSFTFNTGDEVKIYWVVGSGYSYQEENSFIVYYSDTPPVPAFYTGSTTANGNVGPTSWNGENALVYKVRNSMNSIVNGELLGSFTVE